MNIKEKGRENSWIFEGRSTVGCKENESHHKKKNARTTTPREK